MGTFMHKKWVLGGLLLALVTVWYMGAVATDNAATVVFLDIGQGDAVLVTLPGGVQILTDGGPDNTILSKLTRYMPFYDRTIELIVLTHPHADHTRGLNHVLERYKVEAALVSGAYYKSNTYRRFAEALEAHGVKVYAAQAGDKIAYNGRELLRVLSPQEPALGRKYSHVHESNVVTQLRLGDTTFLLVGDIEEDTERALVQAEILDDVDVLKVAHQGSKTSSDPTFLSTVLPEVAIVSVGKNSYGHPHAEVLERFRQLGSRILRTDEQGDIVFTFTME